MIEKYRYFDVYSLDHEVYPSCQVFTPSKLPSEPPEGFTYVFGASGYNGSTSSNYCVVHTTWWNINNYCHWNFSELPFLFLAFESSADNIVLPQSIINVQLPFQKEWMDLLYAEYPKKRILSYSNSKFPDDSLTPVNHDTSNSKKPFKQCLYRHYHISRATPYLISRIDKKYKKLILTQANLKESIRMDFVYINRKTRRLKNEIALQLLLKKHNFHIIDLDGLSLSEQVNIFTQAKIIIGFHGAGLSNLLYSDASTQVIEIVDIDCVYPSYKDGLVILGKKATRTYFHMLCEMKKLKYCSINSQNYVLDLTYFEKELITAIRFK